MPDKDDLAGDILNTGNSIKEILRNRDITPQIDVSDINTELDILKGKGGKDDK